MFLYIDDGIFQCITAFQKGKIRYAYCTYVDPDVSIKFVPLLSLEYIQPRAAVVE